MIKKLREQLPSVPYAELVIRAADSRPIVVTFDQRGGDLTISDGNTADCAEVLFVLALMQQVVRAVHNVRTFKESVTQLPLKESGGGDDIPF